MNRHQCAAVVSGLVGQLREGELDERWLAIGLTMPARIIPTVCVELCDCSNTICEECVDSWLVDWDFGDRPVMQSISIPMLYMN